MIYPVGKNLEDFKKNWYNPQPFGTKVSYGYHDGDDFNLKTGGNTDLGQSMFAIAPGKVVYKKLNDGGWGNHLVIKHTGLWGTVWARYAHCQNIFVNVDNEVSEGFKVATLGNTGSSTAAHLHFSIFKVQGNWTGVAKTLADLNKRFHNPTTFIDKWIKEDDTIPPVDISRKQLIIDAYLALTGEGPSNDEIQARLDSWQNSKHLIESLTGDSRFFKKYVLPNIPTPEPCPPVYNPTKLIAKLHLELSKAHEEQ